MRKYGVIENEKIMDNIPYKLWQRHQQGIPNASHQWAPPMKVFTFKNIRKFVSTSDIFMDWPPQTRVISTIQLDSLRTGKSVSAVSSGY